MSNLAPMENSTCPHCQFPEALVKAGHNRTGTQRYLCRACGRSHTPEPKAAGHDEAKQKAALLCWAACMSARASARCAGVSTQTVVNWVEAAVAEAKQEQEDGTLEPRSLLSRVLVEFQRREYVEALELRRRARRGK